MRVALDPLLALKSKMFVVKKPKKKKISESSMLLFNQEIIKIVIT